MLTGYFFVCEQKSFQLISVIFQTIGIIRYNLSIRSVKVTTVTLNPLCKDLLSLTDTVVSVTPTVHLAHSFRHKTDARPGAAPDSVKYKPKQGFQALQ